MKHYYFEDNASGEQFIVGAYSLNEAIIIAEGYFEEPEYFYIMSEYEAESSGLDEYQKGKLKWKFLLSL